MWESIQRSVSLLGTHLVAYTCALKTTHPECETRSHSMSELPTGTLTLLFTDMEGSTRLLQQLGERYTGVLADCRHLLRSAFAQHHGHEVDTQGDAFFVVFARTSDAVAAAVAVQRVLFAHSW